MRARTALMPVMLIFVFVISFTVSAQVDHYFSYRMNFPLNESREHPHTITFTGNLTVIMPLNFNLYSFTDSPTISVSSITWLSDNLTTINYTLKSPANCTEGTIYYSNIYINGSYVDRFTYVCLPDTKVVDHKVEYGHGCSNYLTERCISNETATIFNLLRVWNIGNYLDPDEDAMNATIVCYYENYPVRTYGRVEINYTPSITGEFLWELIQGGYWFRIGVVSQDVTGQVGGTYGVNCTQLAYKFEHEQVIADFDNYTLNVVSPYPFQVTMQNYTYDNTKYIYTIKNMQSCGVYKIYFNRLIDGYTKTEFFPQLMPGQQISYIGDKLENNTFTINYIPSWHANSLCPVIYTQEVKATVLVNHPPNITWTQPNQTIEINETQNQTFYLNYTDIDNDTLIIRWYVNGTLVQTETDFHPYNTSNYTFFTDCASQGTYNITATVSDYQYTVYYNWTLIVNNSCYCGDLNCQLPETCSTCPADCGVCPPGCGNGVCDGGESCSTCPGDCGTCYNPPSSCFPAGTKILMSDGTQKNIENVAVGDYVTSYDEETEQTIASKVLELENPIRDHMCKIIFADASVLQLTNEHPIYTKQGWKSINPAETANENPLLNVNKLKIGDYVLSSDSGYKIIKDITCWKQTTKTYNLKTIEKTNTFYAEGILVHNKGGIVLCTANITCGEWQPEQCTETAMQTRACYDKNKCSKKTYTESKSCIYILPCLNGKKDKGEFGVDCGGECPPCESCFNQIQDQDETGVDCGGLYCPNCPTCSDGIQNQEEQEIDCGGPCQPCPCVEETCPEIRMPVEICKDVIPSWVILIAILVLCLLCSLVSYNYNFIKAQILKRKKKHKGIDSIELLLTRAKKTANNWILNFLALIFLVWSIFLLPVIDKGCYECRLISSKLILTILLLFIIIRLIIKLFSLTFKNNLIVIALKQHKNRIKQRISGRLCGYYCRKIFWMLLLIALIMIVYYTYARCPAANCSDLIRNQNELGVDCGGACQACPIIEKPADFCGIPPWQIMVIILFVIFLLFLIDYIIYLLAKWKNKELILYDYIKNSKALNIALATVLLLVMFSTLILDRQCFECRQIKSSYLLILTVFFVITFMVYRIYSKAKAFHILNLCKYKGVRLLIVLFLLVIVSATLLELYGYCPRSTCSDGIQNQMEKGIDCGGTCMPCLQSYTNPYLIALMLIILLIFLILYGIETHHRYERLRRVYNIELCPRCNTHMHRKGWLKAGIERGKRTVYACPRCKYRTIRNEQEINLRERICPDCEIEMESKNIKIFGRDAGRMYICPHCGQKRIKIKLFEK
jgi:hypothetical protein